MNRPDDNLSAEPSSGRQGKAGPTISIVIPVWNRADTIRRCFDSILSQAFTDFEIIAVDDGSKDDSVAVMNSYDDPRIRIIRHETNRGSYAARATGFAHARGKWFLVVGSDDALLPDALTVFAEMIATVDDSVGVLGMSYVYDHGGVSPDPPFPTGDVDFVRWLAWTDGPKRLDFLACFRREVFDQLEMPTDGRSGVQFMLRLGATWKARVDPRRGGMVYTDQDNRLTDNKVAILPPQVLMANGVMNEEILEEFGPAIRKYAPGRYRKLFLDTARWYLFAGCRLKGARYILSYLLRRPTSLVGWSHLVVGLFGRKALLAFRAWARRHHS